MPAGPEPITAARRPVGAWRSNGNGGAAPPAGIAPWARSPQRRVDVLVEHRLEDLVAGVAVTVADGDGLVDLVAPAVLFARRRADATENGREGDRPLEDP